MIIGITRVRDEALILEDTLRHVLERVDKVVLYDDASRDETVDIARSFDNVEVIEGMMWNPIRPMEETRHRALLLDRARALGAKWVYCFDADERLVGDGRPWHGEISADAYRFRLFDGYLTPETIEPYSGGELADYTRKWGPEYRDIIMLFRADKAEYKGSDRREPIVTGKVELAPVFVKHYGKCISVEQWEDTCNYYATYWPEPYKSKWAARRGKAIHTKSDFGRPLYYWGELERVGVKL